MGPPAQLWNVPASEAKLVQEAPVSGVEDQRGRAAGGHRVVGGAGEGFADVGDFVVADEADHPRPAGERRHAVVERRCRHTSGHRRTFLAEADVAKALGKLEDGPRRLERAVAAVAGGPAAGAGGRLRPTQAAEQPEHVERAGGHGQAEAGAGPQQRPPVDPPRRHGHSPCPSIARQPSSGRRWRPGSPGRRLGSPFPDSRSGRAPSQLQPGESNGSRPYTPRVLGEPVRGRLPEASFYSLPGIERFDAWVRGLAPRTPANHLTGAICPQFEPGSMVGFLPELAWLQRGDGTVDTRFVSCLAAETLGLLAAPGATKARVASLSVQDLRRCTLSSKTLAVRARLLNTTKRSPVAEMVVEDGLGRAVAVATGTALLEPIDPPPPPARPLSPAPEPAYPTPDPYRRPVRPDAVLSLERTDQMGGWLAAMGAVVEGTVPHPPICDLFGIRITSVSEGFVSGAMLASEWLVGYYPNEVCPIFLAPFASLALTSAASTLASTGYGVEVLEESLSFLRLAPTDGRDLVARASVIHQGRLLISTVEVTDGDGNQVAVGSQTSEVVARRPRRETERRERILATVLFTDIVGSTGKADELGDTRWRQLLEQHHRIVRAQLQTFKGREIKTTGDGFLATFDGPTRAVQCARAIRDALRPLGLVIRAGLHMGECEEIGADVAGVAVHVASRVQSAAAPGEILVSSTVRELITGSGLRLVDRGVHELKGLPGTWALFAIEG